MALEKRNEYNVEVIEIGSLNVRRSDIIVEDGQDIATSYFRYVLNPGDDVSAEPAEVQAIANAVWTPEKISDYQTFIAEEE